MCNLAKIKKEIKHQLINIKYKLSNKLHLRNLKQFAKIIEVTLPPPIKKSIPFKRLSIQSDYVKSGDFVIAPYFNDSNDFVSECIKKGASVIFCSAETKKQFPQNFVIAINNTQDAIYKFEKYIISRLKTKKIVITGSIGKTSSTALINTVIEKSFNAFIRKSGLNLNSYGSILRHLQLLKPSHEYWVQEVGGHEPKYVENSARFLQADVVVLTNISDSHLEHYKTKENIFYDKSSLERYAKDGASVIINYDDEILRNGKYTHNVITCSIKDPKADYFAKNIKMKKDGLYFTAVCPKNREINVHLNLYGEFNAYNALYAIAVGELTGLDLEKIPALLEQYYPSGIRQNHINIGGYSIYADTYNANPESMLSTAKILEKMCLENSGKKIFVSGQINELGQNSEQMHKEIGFNLAKLNIDLILLYGQQAKYTYEGLIDANFKNAIYFNKREELNDWIKNNLTKNDEIFFKSSHGDICLAITIENVFGIPLTDNMDANKGYIVKNNNYKFRIRKYGIMEIAGYTGKENEITLPNSYEDNISIRIGEKAFEKSNIKSIIFPDSVKTICQKAFYKCKKLKNIHLSKDLLYIDKHAFASCSKLSEIEIPENVIHIDEYAFFGCKSLRKVIIHEKVGFIGNNAFKNASKELTFVCKKGSYAEQYAKNNNIKISYI